MVSRVRAIVPILVGSAFGLGAAGCALTLDYGPPTEPRRDAHSSEMDAARVDSGFDALMRDGSTERDAAGPDAPMFIEVGVGDATMLDGSSLHDARLMFDASDVGHPDLGLPDLGFRDVGPDTNPPDAGPLCSPTMMGSCPAGLSCLTCPTGPITDTFLCTTSCTSNAECIDPARPVCAIDLMTPRASFCVPPTLTCIFGAVCASPDTMIATPSGERAIADLQVGDLVFSADEGALRVVPLVEVHQQPVSEHRVVRVVLETGRVLEISPGHPTADGRWFGDLRGGDLLGGVRVVSAELVPYLHGFTYDILPGSDTGTYVAGGALIGSTLTAAHAPIALSAF